MSQDRQVCEAHKPETPKGYRIFYVGPKNLREGERRFAIPCDHCDQMADWLMLKKE